MALSLKIDRYKGTVLQYTDYEPMIVDGVTYGVAVYNVPVSAYDDEDRIIVTLVDAYGTAFSETKTIYLEDACNVVLVSWTDSVGGLNHWPFKYNQEYTFTYENGKKAKRLRLIAENLTLNQWETINGLNTLGDIYKNNITELTSSVYKTHSRIGQQVYATDEEGNTVGVIVIPTENSTFTKQSKHTIEITIEYPEIFLQ